MRRRKALGLTQEALAELLGVERSTVVRWERGESEPAPRIRPRLAKVLRVSADRLEELLDNAGALDASGGKPDAGRDDTAGVPGQLPAAVPSFTGHAATLPGDLREAVSTRLRDAITAPRWLRSRVTLAALAAGVLAIAAGAVLVSRAVSGNPHITRPQAATGNWQCGPSSRVRLYRGSGVGQTLQACVASQHGGLKLKGVLQGSVDVWKEQIVLIIKHPGPLPGNKLISPACTTSTCIYQVEVNPGHGSWRVVPQWRMDGRYQSTVRGSPTVTY